MKLPPGTAQKKRGPLLALVAALVLCAFVASLLFLQPASGQKRFLAARARDPQKPAPQTEALVGVTLWKLRPSTPSDHVRSIIQPLDPAYSSPTSFSPGKVSDFTIRPDWKFRISFEVDRPRYLYLIEREQHGNHQLGIRCSFFRPSESLAPRIMSSQGAPSSCPIPKADRPFGRSGKTIRIIRVNSSPSSL